METTQTGDGDRNVISRIMTRLTIAKLFQLSGKDVSNFNFIGARTSTNYYDDYYSFEDRASDILEFVSGFNLTYDYDEVTCILTVHFPKEIVGHYDFEEALFFGWHEYEFFSEFEDDDEHEFNEPIITLESSAFTFILKNYGGVPIKIMTTFYKLLKENDLL